MKLLADTHALPWWPRDDQRLSRRASALQLPLHHRDPFDRILVAQAQEERLPILTADPKIGTYEVDVIW